MTNCNNHSSFTSSSSSSSLRASVSARGARRGREQQNHHEHSSFVGLQGPTASATIAATLLGQPGGFLSVNHGNPSLVDASLMQRHRFLPTRTTPTSFRFGSSTTSRQHVLHPGPNPRHPLRTAMTCRHEIQHSECIGIIEQALFVVESMDDFDCDDDEWMLHDESIHRF